MLSDSKANPAESSRGSRLLITAAIVSCIFQFSWFASKCFNQIDADGMAYTGIARHVRQGEFHSAINAFRSPLISWLVAALSIRSADYLHIGKVVSVCSFLLCLPLLYTFALRLWHSQLVAALAVLLFALGRGLLVVPLEMVTPDFLFAALVLLYFIIVLRCLDSGRQKNWFFLGIIHGLAFLAKAFALPWLAVCSVSAVLLSDKSWKIRVARLCCAALIPLIVASGWAAVLHSKYGVFTTGSQFKTNLLQSTLREYPHHRDNTYALLSDTTKNLDEYVVADPMPPGSWPWVYHVTLKQALPKLLLAEKSNVPKALKELTIVVTPGVLIAFFVTLVILARKRNLYPTEWRIVAIITIGFLSLVIAYCMLVFDERYLFPLIPLVIAVGARFLIADTRFNHANWRRISIALAILGGFVSLVYPSSPYRVLNRDFQLVSYEAGALLRELPRQPKLVSLGTGPFPEHGVGWEAGYQAAYFSHSRLIAATAELPASDELGILMADLEKALPDAILVWGRSGDSRYHDLIAGLALQFPSSQFEKIDDPVLGEVGEVLFIAR